VENLYDGSAKELHQKRMSISSQKSAVNFNKRQELTLFVSFRQACFCLLEAIINEKRWTS